MALITCPDCGGSVSDAAPACIHCGRPLAAAAAPTPGYSAPAYAAPAPAVDPMARRVEEKAARAAAAKPIAMIGYVLQGLSFFYFIPAIVALVMAYMKRDDARGTWVESHFDWQIETFWKGLWWVIGAIILALVLMFMTDSPVLGTMLLYPVGIGLFIWYIYRVVRGALALYDGRLIP